MKRFIIIFLLVFIGRMGYSLPKHDSENASPKKVYLSYILHGNMNYDRYVKKKIWEEFPVIYDYLLDFIEDHPDFKGQIQLSGQTYNSLKQAAPYVIEHAMKLHKKGQLNFTGTFYSEPVNINMDGETNYRCAKLGTSIISDAFGSTDGFYTQERAYHAQLPWILNHSDVSWVPVITDDETYRPFYLKGMDGSVTVGVPNINRRIIVDVIKKVPHNSLLLIEGDYEIPQSFSSPYQKVCDYDKNDDNIEVEWITVKEYIEKFGISEEKYVDHTAKAKYIESGTYARWTADPLDIIMQDYTNQAMHDFRVATMMNSLMNFLFEEEVDESYDTSEITLMSDPVAWNIEQADNYLDIEPTYFARNGQITIMSKAEHLLLWAVNSDARGWYPLYERRRERINSFKNSSALSQEIINRGLDILAKKIKAEDYDRYFIVFNAEQARKKEISIDVDRPYLIYDYASRQELKSSVISNGGSCKIDFETMLPAYGYKVIALKSAGKIEKHDWLKGNTIENDRIKLVAQEDKIVLTQDGASIELSLDSFKIRALAEMHEGKGDNVWRDAKPYSEARITTRNKFYPELRIEKQIDWLIHMQQTFTLLDDRILCDINFTFPHPTLIRKEGKTEHTSFDPRGLTLMFKTGKKGQAYYDIPFGISPHQMKDLSYFCSLSCAIFQSENDGFMITNGTGEQAFYTNPEQGEIGLFLGASTTSGPISDVKMKFVDQTIVNHELNWYAEPFHGKYNHQLMIYPFKGKWQDKHAPAVSRSFTQGTYIREFYPTKDSGSLSPENSLIMIDKLGVEITSMDYTDCSLNIRLNENEGKDSEINMSLHGKESKNIKIPANGILNIKW